MFLFSKIRGQEFNLIARSKPYAPLVNAVEDGLNRLVYKVSRVPEGTWSLFPSIEGCILTYVNDTHLILGRDHPQGWDVTRRKPFVLGYYLEHGQVPSCNDLKRLEKDIAADLGKLFTDAEKNYPRYKNNPDLAKTLQLKGDYGSNAWDNALQDYRKSGVLDKAIQFHSSKANIIWKKSVKPKAKPTIKNNGTMASARNCLHRALCSLRSFRKGIKK